MDSEDEDDPWPLLINSPAAKSFPTRGCFLNVFDCLTDVMPVHYPNYSPKKFQVQSIKVGQLLLNNDIKANLHLAVYCKVFDLNNNNHDNTASNIMQECDTAKNESKELIEDFTFLFHEDVVEESVDPQNVTSVVWSPKTPKDLTAQVMH